MSKANAGFVCFDARFSCKSARLALDNVLAALRLSALSTSVAALAMVGCGTPNAAILVISAPSTAIAGSPFTVTVTAMAGGSRDRVINSAIHFTSSDSAAVLPLDYQFNATDAGSHTFSNAFTLMTAGSQSITATVTTSHVITGTANVTVTAAATATQSAGRVSSDFSTKVGAEDASESVVTGYNGTEDGLPISFAKSKSVGILASEGLPYFNGCALLLY